MIFLFAFFHFHFAQVVHPNDITIEHVLDISKKRPTFIFFKPRKSNKNQNIIKIWEKLCSKYMEDKKKVIADFSCVKYRQQCNLLNIYNIPSIYAFYGPEHYIKYNGKYSYSIVDKWITEMSSFPIINISSIHEFYNIESNNLTSESVIYLSTKSQDYKKIFEVAYFRNTTNIFLFLRQNNSLNHIHPFNHRITAFLNSNFTISSDEENINFTEFVWKNQFHVPFQLTVDNIKTAKNSRAYLAIYVTKFKKNKFNYAEIKLNEINSSLYKVLKYLGEKYYETTNFCWSDIHKFPIFFKSYGIKKAPALLVLKDDLFWITKNTNIDSITTFMDQILEGQIKGEKMSDMKVIKYDFLLVLLKYPMLILIIIMLLIFLGVVIYFIHVHMKRLRSFSKFEKKLKRHQY